MAKIDAYHLMIDALLPLFSRDTAETVALLFTLILHEPDRPATVYETALMIVHQHLGQNDARYTTAAVDRVVATSFGHFFDIIRPAGLSLKIVGVPFSTTVASC